MQRPSLAQVAKLYEVAVSEGAHPIKAVQEATGASRATAHRWVNAARDAALLTAEGTDKRNAKLLAIAREIGIDYDTLQSACIKHAEHGNLWVGTR